MHGTEEQDDFIGKRFGEKGQIEVVEWDGSRTQSGGSKRYTVKCHICAEDAELFGEGIFKTTKGNLTNGTLPCGCAHTVKWSQKQTITRVLRVCDSKGFILLEFEEKWRGAKTKVKLKCSVDGNTWWIKVSNLLDNRGCPVCGRNAFINSSCKKPDEDMIKMFLSTGAFKNGTVFWRESVKANYWGYHCPSCSSDAYVMVGVCDGIFTADARALKCGKLACRCAKNYRWSQKQREHQITEVCAKECLTYEFIGWVGDFAGCGSMCSLKCKEHGNFSVNIGALISGRRRCPSCAKTGFIKDKTGYIYVLSVEGVTGSFTGYGITNNPKLRITTHKRNLSAMGFSIIYQQIFKMQGRQAFEIESEIKKTFPVHSQEVESFKTEATYSHLYLNVIALIKERLQNLDISQRIELSLV